MYLELFFIHPFIQTYSILCVCGGGWYVCALRQRLCGEQPWVLVLFLLPSTGSGDPAQLIRLVQEVPIPAELSCQPKNCIKNIKLHLFVCLFIHLLSLCVQCVCMWEQCLCHGAHVEIRVSPSVGILGTKCGPSNLVASAKASHWPRTDFIVYRLLQLFELFPQQNNSAGDSWGAGRWLSSSEHCCSCRGPGSHWGG